MNADMMSDSESEGSQFDSESSDEASSLDRTLEVTSSPSHDELIPLLECPVCFDLPLPPIRTCVMGHIICAACTCRLNKCPLCQQQILSGRNFFAENFLRKSMIKCKFRVDGCSQELLGEQIKEHMQNCEFRPLKCKGCRTTIPFSDFEDHMLREHGITKWDLDDNGTRIVKSQKQRKLNNLNNLHQYHGTLYKYPGREPHASQPDIDALFQERPVSTKFLLVSLLTTVVFTAIIDYWYGAPMAADPDLFATFSW